MGCKCQTNNQRSLLFYLRLVAEKMSLDSTSRNTESTKTMKRSALFTDFFGLHFKKVKPDSFATFVINLRKEVQNRALVAGRPVFSECSLILHTGKHQYKLWKTREKETVIIANRQAPVTQKQKKTDHIDEELRFEIFKTSAIIFFLLF